MPGHQLQDARPFFEHVPCLIIPVLDRESFGRRARLVFERDVGAEGYQTPDCWYVSTNSCPHQGRRALFGPTVDLRAFLQDERDDVSISLARRIMQRRDAIMQIPEVHVRALLYQVCGTMQLFIQNTLME